MKTCTAPLAPLSSDFVVVHLRGGSVEDARDAVCVDLDRGLTTRGEEWSAVVAKERLEVFLHNSGASQLGEPDAWDGAPFGDGNSGTVALVDGKISMSHARTLLGLEDEDSRERLFRRMLEGLTVREAEEEVTIVKTGGKAKRMSADPNLMDLVTRLRSALSTKVAIKRTARGTGEIRVHFQDDEDLHGLVARLAPQPEEGIA
jgi:hypothetical protein